MLPLACPQKHKMMHKNSPKKIVLIFSTYLVFAGVCLYYFIQPFLAERHYRDGYNFHAMKRYKYAIEDLQKACRYAPWETHYKMQLGKTYEKQAEQQKDISTKDSDLEEIFINLLKK